MINVNWPAKSQWSNEDVQAYYTQQMALLMERQVKALEDIGRLVSHGIEKAWEDRNTAQLALELMTNREVVELVFNGRDRVPLSELQYKLSSRGIRCWMDGLRMAITMTDYLMVEAAGRGWRVRLTGLGDEAQSGAAG